MVEEEEKESEPRSHDVRNSRFLFLPPFLPSSSPPVSFRSLPVVFRRELFKRIKAGSEDAFDL